MQFFFFNLLILKEFFDALKRAKEIHNDCKLLLLSKQQTTGLVFYSENVKS